MRFRTAVGRLAAALALALLCLSATGARAQTEPQDQSAPFVLQDKDGNRLTKVTLRAPATGTAETLTVYLAQTGNKAVNVTLAATSVDIAPPNLTVPPQGGRVAVTLKPAAGPDVLQTVDLNLTVETTGVHPLARVEIVRESSLELLSHGAEGVKEAAWPSPRYTGSVEVRAKGQQPLEVRVRFDPLRASDSTTPLTVSANGKGLSSGDTVTVAANDRLVLALGAELVAAGTYTSRLQLETGKPTPAILAVPISITRTNVALSLSFDAPAPVRVTRGLRGGSTEATVKLDGRETAGRTVVVNQFDLAVPRTTDAAGTTQPDGLGLALQEPKTFAPYAPIGLSPVVTGFAHAGTYTASIRMSGQAGSTLDVPISVVVRDHISWAALCIFVGVLLAAGLSLLGGRAMQRFERRARAKLRINEINDVLDRNEPVGEAIDLAGRFMIQRLRDEVLGRRGWALGRQTVDLATKRLVITDRHMPLLELTCVAAKVVQQTKGSRAAVDQAVTLLRDGTDDTDKEAELSAALRKIIADARTGATSDHLARVRALVEAAGPQLSTEVKAHADDLLGQAERTADPVTRQGLVAQAEAAAAEHLVDTTIERARATGKPEIVTAFEQDLDKIGGDERRTLAGARKVQLALVGAVTKWLDIFLTQYEGAQYEGKPEGEAAKQHRATLNQAAAATEPAEKLRLVTEVLQWAQTRDATLGPAEDLLRAFHILPEPEPAVPVGAPPPRARVNADVDLAVWAGAKFIIWLAVAVATVFFGLYALYQNDASWGGWPDYFVAVFWGAGISAGGVATATGMSGARKLLGLGGSGAG